ncbi:MAG: DNA glycosylase [Nitrososphaerales archaeon]
MKKRRLNDPILDLNHTLLGGQTFGWRELKGFWYGTAYGQVLKVKVEGKLLSYDTSGDDDGHDLVSRYFKLDENLPNILKQFEGSDDLIEKAIASFKGLRVLNQQPWECILSFLCSSNSNIATINMMIHDLSMKFGDRIVFDGMKFHTLPRPEVLDQASTEELRDCKVGYRANYIKTVAHEISVGNFDINSLSKLNYSLGRNKLLNVENGHKVMKGIGPKVADCILLFSLGKNEAFPCDIWISRVILAKYKHLLDTPLLTSLSKSLKQKTPLSGRTYAKIGDVMRRYFGSNAGYAQQYLYAQTRQDYGRGPIRSQVM